MAKFKVGEVAIFCGLVNCAELNGTECVVIDGLEWRTGTSRLGRLVTSRKYVVRSVDGELMQAEPQYLRKRRPPSTDESAARQAMLDCIQKAKQPQLVSA